ncbi:MAG: helix-turn-helix transcriptional regulator [Bacteroidota bacterium]
MKKLPYTKIKSLEQYNEYCNIHESLFAKDEEKYADEIELLEILIEDYDQRSFKNKYQALNPVELLRTLIRDNEWSQSEFAQQIGISKQLVSDVLGYRRNISKELVLKLAKFFSMREEAFSRPYTLAAKRSNFVKK